jgi:hypothetical protein
MAMAARTATASGSRVPPGCCATPGLRRRVDDPVWALGVTENLQNVDNTPDIGFLLLMSPDSRAVPACGAGARTLRQTSAVKKFLPGLHPK